jgi:hypothetical protein
MRTGRGRTRGLVAAALAAFVGIGGGVALAGCGAAYPDVLVVSRGGSLPAARLQLLVNDGGTVRCNGGRPRDLPARLLLDARDIARSLAEDAKRELVLPRRGNALLRFRLRTQDGSITFSDVDAVDRPELARVIAFTRATAQAVCGLPR